MADRSKSSSSGWFGADTFKTVVAVTPPISIDLLVQNEQGKYLLGLRNSRPAQGYWSVPDGRVLKRNPHSQSQWAIPEAMNSLNVHPYTQDYFEPRYV